MAQEATFTNSIGMEFVLIKPGKMVVGKFQPTVSPYVGPQPGQDREFLPPAAYKEAKEMAAAAAMPGFTVSLDCPYYIGKYEVTQEQWEKVMGSNPSFFKGDKVAGDAGKHPVGNVTWKDARKFIKKLNKLDKQYTYRLPTEFEWEYAARAGTEDDIAWGEARAMGVISDTTTRAVGSKQPNAWGLHDMIGNVWEWVDDYYNEQIFADPVPPRKGTQHVLKGASFTGDAKNATYMTHAAGPGNGFDVGFRVVVEARP
ncbi:formylglycine-generating enzyme family protein [Pontibacter mangrovi]|uniref:Formylglycine-generating enzyme family protein n=1 Tax=Pontibacter mangrovi TaxID=2589816 RepID=A0A501W7G4_9BACT|nr:formylglycine-generating enzyme family protein [Pontibacter mangrovi]